MWSNNVHSQGPICGPYGPICAHYGPKLAHRGRPQATLTSPATSVVYPPNPHDFHLRPYWPNMPCDSLSRFYRKCVNECCELLRSNYDPNENNLDDKSLRTKSAMQPSERHEKQVGTWITLRRPRPCHHANVSLMISSMFCRDDWHGRDRCILLRRVVCTFIHHAFCNIAVC
jgi:hypothetical protein